MINLLNLGDSINEWFWKKNEFVWKGSKKLFHIKGSDKINIPKETPINLQLKPAKNNIYIPATNITKLVPKSGWILTKFATTNIIAKVIKVFNKLIGRVLSYRYAAKKTGKAIFIISDDCKVNNPRSSHLFAPLTSLPTKRVKSIKIIEKIRKINELFL